MKDSDLINKLVEETFQGSPLENISFSEENVEGLEQVLQDSFNDVYFAVEKLVSDCGLPYAEYSDFGSFIRLSISGMELDCPKAFNLFDIPSSKHIQEKKLLQLEFIEIFGRIFNRNVDSILLFNLGNYGLMIFYKDSKEEEMLAIKASFKDLCEKFITAQKSKKSA